MHARRIAPSLLDSTSVGLVRHDVYLALVALHVLCAIVGFGAVAISGVYGWWARSQNGGETAEEVSRYLSSRNLAELLVVPVPFLGLAALLVGRRAIGPLWVLIGTICWLVAVTLLFIVVRLAEARIREALAAGGRGAAPGGTRSGGRRGSEQLGLRLGVGSAVMDLAFFVALSVMVVQPR